MSRSKISIYSVSNILDQEEKINMALDMLGLVGIRSTLDKIVRKFTRKEGTLYDFLEQLLETQLAWKEGNKIQRWIQKAKFPFLKTLNNFDFSYQPSIDEAQIRELASCRFIKHAENILFFGQTGVGKTHLAIGLGYEAISKGYDVRFITIDQLIELADKYSGDLVRSKRLFDSLMQPKLLILDEMDYSETRQNKLISEMLFRIIYQRYEKGSNEYSSQLAARYHKSRLSWSL